MAKKGDSVMISGLEANPEFNGKYGEILDGPLESGRCANSLECRRSLVWMHPEIVNTLLGHASHLLHHTCMPCAGTE
mgnify:CR=1 FL=1